MTDPLTISGAAQDSFEVSVSPAAPVVAYGGAVWINCSTTCPDPDARGSLENTSLTKTDEKTGPGWVAFLLKNITEWVSAPQCQFTCRGRVKVAFANISAYRKCRWLPAAGVWGGFCATETFWVQGRARGRGNSLAENRVQSCDLALGQGTGWLGGQRMGHGPFPSGATGSAPLSQAAPASSYPLAAVGWNELVGLGPAPGRAGIHIPARYPT